MLLLVSKVEALMQENARLKAELSELKARSVGNYSAIQAYNSGAEAMRERLIELLKSLRAPGETEE